MGEACFCLQCFGQEPAPTEPSPVYYFDYMGQIGHWVSVPVSCVVPEGAWGSHCAVGVFPPIPCQPQPPPVAVPTHPACTTAPTMICEITAAVAFISHFLRTKGLTSEEHLQTFSQTLQELLTEHYKHHWFPDMPCKGSGYRCIRINHRMDPLITQAAQSIGLSSQELFRLLPSELTLWVDPYEVCYRIGEDGSICVLYEASPAGESTETTSDMVDNISSCKEELMLDRASPSKSYNMMAVSS
ncbi:protein BTG1-like isoform 1-T1 [Thomomys bottae]